MAITNVLAAGLERIFGNRLECLATYGGNGEAESLTGGAGGDDHDHVHTVAVVASISAHDLKECANLSAGWHKQGLATPLVLTRAELARSLDAFPLEFAEIIAHHRVVRGTDVFGGLTVAASDIRRACEVRARSHVLHLREGYIETEGDERALAGMIQQSARPFRLLLVSLGRLEGVDASDAEAFGRHLTEALRLNRGVVDQVLAAGGRGGIGRTEAQDLYPAYLEAVERIVQHIDGWKA